MTTSDYVAAELRAHMARQRISGVHLAAAMHRPQKWVSRRLTGEVPLTLDELYEIAGALREDPRNLLPHLDSNQEPAGYRRVRTLCAEATTFRHLTALAA